MLEVPSQVWAENCGYAVKMNSLNACLTSQLRDNRAESSYMDLVGTENVDLNRHMRVDSDKDEANGHIGRYRGLRRRSEMPALQLFSKIWLLFFSVTG